MNYSIQSPVLLFILSVWFPALAQVPSEMNYQGRVLVEEQPFQGTGLFKFALIDPGVNVAQQAEGTLDVVNGFIVGAEVTVPGRGYVEPPSVTVEDPEGSGAQLTAEVKNGKVTSISVDQTGSGYSAAFRLTIAPPPPEIMHSSYWSNDGTSTGGDEPVNAVSLPVNGGLFSVNLGDSSLPHMSPLPPAVFRNDGIRLRIWMSDGVQGFAQLGPDQPVVATGYAMLAARALEVPLTGLPVGTGSNQLAPGDHTHVHDHDAMYWSTKGNGGTDSTTHFLGTTDDQALELRVNNMRVARFDTASPAPNIVMGHTANHVTDGVNAATVSGGGFFREGFFDDYNMVSASYGTVGGGRKNWVTGFAGTVPGGFGNHAAGIQSFAAGSHSKALHNGAVVISDAESTGLDFESTTNNQFSVRCTGGARIVTAINGLGNPASGAVLNPGGSSWQILSDRRAKENIQPVDTKEVLNRVVKLPIHTWNYKTQPPEIRHMGPMAQDFRAAFSLGADETHINTLDPDGVALAALQGLHQTLLEELDARDAALRTMAKRLKELENRLRNLTSE